jgi:hypothetical protein
LCILLLLPRSCSKCFLLSIFSCTIDLKRDTKSHINQHIVLSLCKNCFTFVHRTGRINYFELKYVEVKVHYLMAILQTPEDDNGWAIGLKMFCLPWRMNEQTKIILGEGSTFSDSKLNQTRPE